MPQIRLSVVCSFEMGAVTVVRMKSKGRLLRKGMSRAGAVAALTPPASKERMSPC